MELHRSGSLVVNSGLRPANGPVHPNTGESALTIDAAQVPIILVGHKAVLTSPACLEPGHRGPREMTVEVPSADAEAMKAGAFVQRALLTLDRETREWFASGICPRCRRRLFGEG